MAYDIADSSLKPKIAKYLGWLEDVIAEHRETLSPEKIRGLEEVAAELARLRDSKRPLRTRAINDFKKLRDRVTDLCAADTSGEPRRGIRSTYTSGGGQVGTFSAHA